MWHIMFIVLLIFAIILMLFSVQSENHPFWNLISCIVSIPIWFILGLGNIQIEIPYQIYNASSSQIEVGVHNFTSPIAPFLTYLFVGIGIIMMIYMIAMVFDKWYNFNNWHGGGN